MAFSYSLWAVEQVPSSAHVSGKRPDGDHGEEVVDSPLGDPFCSRIGLALNKTPTEDSEDVFQPIQSIESQSMQSDILPKGNKHCHYSAADFCAPTNGITTFLLFPPPSGTTDSYR